MHASTRFTLAAVLALVLVPSFALAQGDKPARPENSADTPPQPTPYTLTLAVKESSSGKSVQEKDYRITIVADDRIHSSQNLRDGDRIPYASKDGQQYENVGTDIDIQQVASIGNSLAVTIGVDSTSLVATPNFNPGNLPQISQWRIRVSAVLLPGKPTVVYSATDGISGRKVEIQATVVPFSAK